MIGEIAMSRQTTISIGLLEAAANLCRALEGLEFSAPTTHVYNPLIYAHRPHEAYLSRYASQDVDTLLVGMNPGPWGMAQTGVPFGEVGLVRDFLGIEETVDQPSVLHPK